MEDYYCENCKYFRQHYVHFYENHYTPIPCGHCTYPRLKHRTPNTEACFRFLAKGEQPVPNKNTQE